MPKKYRGAWAAPGPATELPPPGTLHVYGVYSYTSVHIYILFFLLLMCLGEFYYGPVPVAVVGSNRKYRLQCIQLKILHIPPTLESMAGWTKHVRCSGGEGFPNAMPHIIIGQMQCHIIQ